MAKYYREKEFNAHYIHIHTHTQSIQKYIKMSEITFCPFPVLEQEETTPAEKYLYVS